MQIRKPEIKALFKGNNEDKNSGKGPNKIGAGFAEEKQKIKSLKIKRQKS